MTAKAYLSQIYKLTQTIEQLEEEIARNRSTQLPGAVRYDRDRVQTSPEDKLAEYAAAFDALAQRQAKEMLKLARKRDRIIHQLDHMENLTMARLLRYRYIDLLSWRKIADRMNYSYTRIRHKHAEALNEFEKEFMKG